MRIRYFTATTVSVSEFVDGVPNSLGIPAANFRIILCGLSCPVVVDLPPRTGTERVPLTETVWKIVRVAS